MLVVVFYKTEIAYSAEICKYVKGELLNGPILPKGTEPAPGQRGCWLPPNYENKSTPPSTNEDWANNLPICKWDNWSVSACLVHLFYVLFNTIPAFFLAIAGRFFDLMISITLSSFLFKTDFVSEAWSIVRDLSNIFFILILLYVAFQKILGLGGHEAKKTIAHVVIVALLINFSMFFTNVVIDTSNILARVFYSKISLKLEDKTGAKVTLDSIGVLNPAFGVEDKGISLRLVSAFNPLKVLGKDFFDRYQKKTTEFSITSGAVGAAVGYGAGLGAASVVTGVAAFLSLPVTVPLAAILGIGGTVIGVAFGSVSTNVPLELISALILISGAIMIFAIYAFIVASMAFMSRLIELWVLIIFSPFAFMSSAVPFLNKVPMIGWQAWFDRLLSVSFMAPIFMFFLYLISILLQANIFSQISQRTPEQEGWITTILLLILPAALILSLLLYATKFAKKASGQMGEVVMGAGKAIAGLAIGGAALGVAGGAMLGRNVLGKGAAALTKGDGALKYGQEYRAAQLSYGQKMEEWNKKTRAEKQATPLANRPKSWNEHRDEALRASGVQYLDWKDKLGGRINATQIKKQEVSHANHEMETLRKEAGIEEGTHEANISGVQEQIMKTKFEKDNRRSVESDVALGHDAKEKPITVTVDLPGGLTKEVTGKDEYKQERIAAVSKDVLTTPGALASGDTKKEANPAGGTRTVLTQQGNAKVQSILDKEFGQKQKDKATTILKDKYTHLRSESKEKVSVRERVMASTPGGSYDPRNLSMLKAGKLDSVSTKAAMGIMAAVANGIRAGLKKTTGMDGGTSKRDFTGDLKEILSGSLDNALKNFKVNIDIKGGGDHGGKKDDHGQGGGGGHH